MGNLTFILDAVYHSPKDNVLWLALADCLEEQGETERAELTRLTLWGRSRRDAPEEQRRVWGERQRALLASGVLPCVPRIVNSIGMCLALIPAGTFVMGSPEEEAWREKAEGPQHEVAITRAFYLGVHTVTQAQYQKVMGKNPSHFKTGGSDHPVETVSWEEAAEFCRKLSRLREEKACGRSYRLPSEAEWEYACRAGAPFYQPFHFGSSLSSTQANFDGRYPYGGGEVGEYRQKMVAVDLFQPNAFGLWQMHGNVWEWCADWFDEGYYNQSPPQNPPGAPDGSHRVVRGGSWYSYGGSCRSAYRDGCLPGSRYGYLGFRVAFVYGEDSYEEDL